MSKMSTRDIENAFLASVLKSEANYSIALKNGIHSKMLVVYSNAYDWISKYHTKHGRLPTQAAFSLKFNDIILRNANDTEFLCEEIRTEHARRQLVEIVRDVGSSVANGDLGNAYSTINNAVSKVASSLGHSAVTNMYDDYDYIYNDVERRVMKWREGGIAGVPTGIGAIDRIVGGFNRGEVAIISARLGAMKSFLMQYCAANASLSGHKVLFNALEQSRVQVALRVQSLMSGIFGGDVWSSSKLMQGREIDLDAYREFLGTMRKKLATSGGDLRVVDTSERNLSLMELRGQIEVYKPDIVFVDYLTLMDTDAPDWQGVAILTKGLKQLAMRYDIPIVAAAQLNRQHGVVNAKKEEPPDAEALAQGDSIGRDADVVFTQMMISRRVLAMKLAKSRNTIGGLKWFMHVDPDNGVFRTIDATEKDDLVIEDNSERFYEDDA